MFNNNNNNNNNGFWSQPPQQPQNNFSTGGNQWGQPPQFPNSPQQGFNGEYPIGGSGFHHQQPQQGFNGEYPMGGSGFFQPPQFSNEEEFPMNEPPNVFSFRPQPPNNFMTSVSNAPAGQRPPPFRPQQPPPPMFPPAAESGVQANRGSSSNVFRFGADSNINADRVIRVDSDDDFIIDNGQNGNNAGIVVNDGPKPAASGGSNDDELIECIMCFKKFPKTEIEAHVDSHFNQKEDKSGCSLCGCGMTDDIFFLDECGHFFCTNCLHAHIIKQISQDICDIKCPDKTCNVSLSSHSIRSLLTPTELSQLEKLSFNLAAQGGNFLTCPNATCGVMMEFIDAAPSASDLKAAEAETDASGKPLTPEAAKHRCRYRIRCRACGTDFCAKCSRTPYHAGFTCEAFEAYGKANHCRYCHGEAPPGRLACDDPECADKASHACGKPLPCGHLCYGIAGERTHLVCLHEDCQDSEDGVDGSDFCNICFCEELSAAPAIRLACGHVFHYACVLEKLRKRWTGSRITFGFMLCPLCKREMSHPALEAELRLIRPIKKSVEEKALRRLKDMGLDKSEEVCKEGSQFYNKPLEYAMHKFCYYLCYKCKEPYYGGDRACGNEEDRPNDPSELLCVKCNPFHAEVNCKIHGSEYIEWKCRFCCNVAAFFCWGTTHFCEKCHKEAAKIARMPRDQLPKCTCGIPHPPNGEEYLLGCSLCRLKKACYN